MSKPRIAIADDHPEVLNRVAKFLADKFEIVALASGGAAAANAVLASKPDVWCESDSKPKKNNDSSDSSENRCLLFEIKNAEGSN